MSKGFTLVELLAVIVILAVLALIATPVVLSIIDDAKESAMLRSAEMYLSGVENAVMRENMNSGGNFRPNECSITNGNMTCGSTNVEVEVDGEVPSTGSIVFENGKITQVTLNYESGTIVKDESGNLVYEGSENASICTLASDSTVEAGKEGAKYSCKVDPNKDTYTFYLLDNNEDGTSDLIMDANINASGEKVIPGVTSDAGLTAWLSKNDYIINNGTNVEQFEDQGKCQYGNDCSINELGPVTAMTYLYNVTKSWTNVKPLNYEYYDRETQGITTTDRGYVSFISRNGIATITKGDNTGTQITIGSSSEPLRARMPIYSSDASITEVSDKTELNSYLYDNFDAINYNAPRGYWTMSSVANISGNAWLVALGGNIYESYNVASSSDYGVRPVITVRL